MTKPPVHMLAMQELIEMHKDGVKSTEIFYGDETGDHRLLITINEIKD